MEAAKENFFKTFLKFPKKNILLILFFLGFGEWLISDVMNFSGGSLGFIILCFGSYLYLKTDKAIFNEPKNLKGWIDRVYEQPGMLKGLEVPEKVENLLKDKKAAEKFAKGGGSIVQK